MIGEGRQSVPARKRRWGVRKRAVLAATSMVLIAFIGGGAILLILLQQALVQSASDDTVTTARGLASQYADTSLPGPHSVSKDLKRRAQEVQIVTPLGVVVAASDEELLEHSLVKDVAAPGKAVTYDENSPQIVGQGGDVVVSTAGFVNNGERYAVNVLAEVDVQKKSVRTVGIFLLAGAPVLLLIVAVSTWVLVGRSLEQVEKIRQQVDGISRARLRERVDVPPTADEISRLAATMNKMLGRLEVSDAKQREFLADASHELRSPLSTLAATLEIAIADNSGQTWRDMQKVLVAQTERMRRLVDDLLTLARADDQGITVRPTEEDLDDLIATEVIQLRTTSPYRITTRVEPIRLRCDGPRIGQVLRNLLDNADRHARTRISVTARIDGHDALVDVDNDGPVVPLADRERVFERFVRLDDSRSRDSGNSGLGLAIAAELIKAHGGTLESTESADGLCRFRFTLPIAKEFSGLTQPSGGTIE